MNKGCVFAIAVLIFSASSFAESKSGSTGLIATYADGQHRVVTVAPTPNFVLKDSDSIHPQLGTSFTAEWNGFLKIDKRAPYTLTFDGAPNAKVLLDGQELSTKPIDLDLGDHPIQITFTRKPGAVRGQLLWSSDFFAIEPIPPAVLLHRDLPPQATLQSRIEAGQLLVEQLNCTACHRTTSTTLIPRPAPDLSAVGTRLRPAWIAPWLTAPRTFRADTAMPKVPLNADEVRDVAAYLATLKNPNNKVKEPQPSISHIETGRQLVDTVGCTACHGGAKGHSLEGLGSKWLPGQLAEYLLNPKSVDHSGRMPSMLLAKEEAQAIAEFLVQSKKPEFEAKPASGDIKHGGQLFQSQGCVNCHAMESSPTKSVAFTGQPATSFEKLIGTDKGCLSAHPGGRAMDYGLSVTQRELIAAFMDSVRAHPMVTAAPVYEFQHRAQAFGCINCHELNASMPSDSTERVPQLTNVGGRLRREWIGEVLTQKRRVRPWLRRRMPEFDAASIGDMPAFAVAASGAGEVEPLPVPTRDEIAAGQKLLGNGTGGFGCITCHGLAGAKPNVIDDTRGPDITTVANRLRPDHFRRWVLDPKRVSPSTPMPSFFEGMPVVEAHAKVEGIFRYVAMGENMPPPMGWVDKNNYQVAVHDEPVILRAFLPGAEGGHNLPRGIAVGLPGLINYCFDADTCTLKYAWTGGFLDMQPSWSGRGGNMVKVLGKRFYTNSIYPLRIGDSEEPATREFMGYSIVEGKPQFVYRIGEVEVREVITTPEKQLGLVRTFELDSGDKPVTLSVVDEPGVTYSAMGGELEPAQVTTAKGTVAGRILKSAGGKLKLSITLTVKELK